MKIPRLNTFPAEEVVQGDYASIVAQLPVPGTTLHELGKSVDDEHDIYGLSYGAVDKKPTIVIFGCVHGTEWVSAYYPLRWMEILAGPGRPWLSSLRHNFSWFLVPVVNPWGFQNARSYNKNTVNINRNYDTPEWPERGEGTEPFSEPEAQICRDVLLTYNPPLLLDCHTRGGGEDGRIYRTRNMFHHRVWEKSVEATVMFNAPDIPWHGLSFPDDGPNARAWWEKTSTSLHGIPNMGITFEPGNLMAVSEQMYAGLNMIYMASKRYEDYFYKRKLSA